MANFKEEKNILRQIAKSREAIRRKHKLLKQDEASFEKAIDETFKPIVYPLEKLVDATKMKTRENIEPKPIEKKLENTQECSSSEASQSDLDETIKHKSIDTSFETAESEQENDQTINREYVSMFQEHPTALDNIFGVRVENGTMTIGNSPINFTKDYVTVRNAKYPKTVGLLELLFKKQPEQMYISTNDVQNYRKIVETTNAFRRNYDENQPLRKSTSKKYKNYIAPFFDKSTKRNPRRGSGLLPRYKIARKDTLTDYVY